MDLFKADVERNCAGLYVLPKDDREIVYMTNTAERTKAPEHYMLIELSKEKATWTFLQWRPADEIHENLLNHYRDYGLDMESEQFTHDQHLIYKATFMPRDTEKLQEIYRVWNKVTGIPTVLTSMHFAVQIAQYISAINFQLKYT